MMQTGSSRHLAIVFITLLVITHITLAVMSSSNTNDDAFISFRYAKNLVEGRGLVFNPGERVEGYTNFLWVMIISLLIPFFDPVPASKILGVACNILLIVSVWRFSRKHLGKLAWIPPVFLALDPSVLRWSTRGLETSLFMLLLWLTFSTAASDKIPPAVSGLIAALATMARPEGILAAVVVSMGLFIRPRQIRFKEFLSFWIGCLILIVPHLLWKFIYYGNILPNTFYAKTGGGVFRIWRGAAYITHGWGWPELILGFLLLCAVLWKNKSRELRAASFTGLAFILYILWVGGDSLGPDRFLAPVASFLVFSAVAASHELFVKSRRNPGFIIVHIVFAVILALNTLPMKRLVEKGSVYSSEKEAAHPRTLLGKCLAETAEMDDLLATSLIGRTPYYSGLFTLDVFGLIDPHIARRKIPNTGAGAAGHEKTDIEYILRRNPTWIIGNELVVSPPREHPWLKALRKQISGDPPSRPFKLLTPPFDGYTRKKVQCGDYTCNLWNRDGAN